MDVRNDLPGEYFKRRHSMFREGESGTLEPAWYNS